MFIIILYAAGALALLTLYVALLVTLTGIYAATQAPEYAGRLTPTGSATERHTMKHKTTVSKGRVTCTCGWYEKHVSRVLLKVWGLRHERTWN